MRKLAACTLTIFSLSAGPLVAAEGSPLFVEVCATCHGEKGQGNPELKTPSIAGQPDWYTLEQLHKFRSDMRGVDPTDTTGVLMHAIALGLEESAMKEVAAHIVKLPTIPTANTLGGDPAKGRILYEENCIDCHRYNGKGERVFKSPSLIAYQDWYIVSQLTKFRTGVRGTHPDDVDGEKMHRITGFLESEEDFVHIAAHIASLAKKYAP